MYFYEANHTAVIQILFSSKSTIRSILMCSVICILRYVYFLYMESFFKNIYN
jgi:hypothetical protein